MVVGNGLIATAFLNYSEILDVVIFASGVSNSNETRHDAFAREYNLLTDWCLKVNEELLVYFSTCSIEDKEQINSPYVNHKLNMESIVKNCPNHIIFRLPQLVGNTQNQHTLVNFLYSAIMSGKDFEVRQFAYRNLIDIEDVYKVGRHIIENQLFHNTIVNIASPKLVKVMNIVKILEKITGKTANYHLSYTGNCYEIDITKVEKFFKDLRISFNENYVNNLLVKYYGVNK
jgi:nucleoside-diphosphate-sugar epimerase